MFNFKISAIITFILAVVSVGSILFGATWFALVTGIMAIFAAIWWLGSLEKEGSLC